MLVAQPMEHTFRGLRPGTLVVIDRNGPCLPRTSNFKRRALELGDLVALHALARTAQPPADWSAVEPAGSVTADTAQQLIDELRSRGLFAEPGPDDAGSAPDNSYEPDRYTFAQSDPAEIGEAPEPGDHTGRFMLSTPVVLRLSADGFEYLDHDGNRLACVTPAEMVAACCFLSGATVADALAAHRAAAGDHAIDAPAIESLVSRLRAVRLLQPMSDDGDESANEGREVIAMRRMLQSAGQMIAANDRYLEQHRAAERERSERTGITRTPVVPVDVQMIPQLSIGMVMAYAMAYEDGRLLEHFDFVPDWMHRTITTLSEDDPPGIYLFSNYIWNHNQNLQATGEIKRKSPNSLIIHGGPDTPKYEADVETYLRMTPEVDIIVRGEGEATMAELLSALQSFHETGHVDTAALREVAGICFRDGDEIVRTDDRERITDVDSIPSPFLVGLFDSVGDEGISLAVLESNRGCPYGCTFCDWGSATASRIRKFSLERVFAELEWCARHKVNAIYLADANFGIFPRDVEIAQKVADLRSEYGYPRVFETNYAKNTVKHLRQCVEILANAGIITEGILSLQSMDEDTLSTIRRSNIKLEKYEALATEFRKAKLPLVVDIMMGLPGSTIESFKGDLQQCVNREVRARVFPTQLLVNSPMNEPTYRNENAITTRTSIADTWDRTDIARKKIPIVVASSTFTQADYEAMKEVRQLFRLCENFGVLRQVARFVRQETGVGEVDFYAGLAADSAGSPQLSTVAFTFEAIPYYMQPPASWAMFLDELRWYLTEVLGVADDGALETIITVQHALLPSRGRVFPATFDLPHDYAVWYQAMLDAKAEGHYDDWPEVAPRLRDIPPGTFTVDDPNDICEQSMGFRMDFDSLSDWELGSPVARVMGRRHLHL